MEVVEIAQLYREIKKHYPFFDASVEKVKADYKYLKDFPAEAAQENIDRYILTETAEPKIANIRGRLGEQLERERMRQQTAELFAVMDEAHAAAVPPPAGLKERLYARLGIRR